MGPAKSQKFNLLHINSRRNYYRTFIIASGAFLFAYLSASIFAPVKTSNATQEVQASITAGNYYVNVSAEPSVSISIDSSGFGSTVSTIDTLSAETDLPSGYQIYLSTTSNDSSSQRLYNDTAYIAPPESDLAALSENTWGFATADNYNEDKWSAVPVLGSQALVAEQSAPGGYEEAIHFGVKVNSDMASGTYTGEIMFTIIGDAPIDENNPLKISPTSGFAGNTTLNRVTLTTTLASTGITEENLSELGTVTATIDGEACTNQSLSISGQLLQITCTPPSRAAGAVDVSVSIERFGKVYTLTNGYTYLPQTMQNFTTDMCALLPESTSSSDNRLTLTDSRDNKTYKIARLKDGNCWMVQNLALDGMDEEGQVRKLYPDDSNVTAERPLATNVASGIATNADAIQILSAGATTIGENGSPYGNLYNYKAATAGLGSSTSTGTIYESVCPKNWRMSDQSTAQGSKSYNILLPMYGMPSTASYGSYYATLVAAPLYFPTSGYSYNNTSRALAGGYNKEWTRVASNTARAYAFEFRNYDSPGYWGGDASTDKSGGASVRCVLGE